MRLNNLSAAFFASVAAGGVAFSQDLQPGANFAPKPGSIPQSTSYAEASHFADFDMDGDLDAFLTQGGAFSALQSRLWFNNASTAGGNFVFSDVTGSKLPALLAESVHVESADVDRDGDLDLMLVNTTQFFTQSNIWLINQGGAQGGTAGVFFIDTSRWNGLGGAGSSIPSSLLISSGTFSGGFADWSNACDFADVDLDGDMDYLQTSAGPNYSGAVMSRLFMNNGAGIFAEYNPSGTVSGSLALAAGSQAGWCEGSQLDNTASTNGGNHDITNVAFDADFADVDNDFDVDLLINNRTGQSRMYQNRFVDNNYSAGSEGMGTRLFRDVTGSALATAQSGGQCMDFAFGDIDLDDDVDMWAVSYASLQDRILSNNGSGIFSSIGAPLGDPSADENQADFVDYDGDGDLDVALANFDGINYIYKNTAAQGGSTSTASSFLLRTSVLGTEPEMNSPGTNADTWLSVSVGDLDNDNDADLLFSHDGSATNAGIWTNTLGVADAVAPRIPRVGLLSGSSVAGSTPHVVAAQVYENDSTERFRESTASVKYTIDGGPVHTSSAAWAGGNIFRGQVPGYWFGSIDYWFEVRDRAGNTGASAHHNIQVASNGLSNSGYSTPGCNGFQHISANSAATPGNGEFEIHVTNCPPNSMNLLIVSSIGAPLGIDFQLGLWVYVDLGAPEILLYDEPSLANGLGIAAIPLPSSYSAIVGSTYHAQSFSYWGNACNPSPLSLSTSEALDITLVP
ncbi:MAG: VCBS repeat-containing protein [Planctomycetes bacterium]|nr:VCBS repeat-containing protein [Planctomycetota bacterium]